MTLLQSVGKLFHVNFLASYQLNDFLVANYPHGFENDRYRNILKVDRKNVISKVDFYILLILKIELTSWNILCLRKYFAPFPTILDLVFFSCVELVQEATTQFLLSSSRMILFLSNCSWIRITFSTPLMIK